MPLVIVAIALLGLAIGSFLNVVIYRVPAQISLSRPPSRCPECGTAVLGRHNVPVLSWLRLRGRCANCRMPISWRYPVVEILTAGLFVATTIRLNHLHLLAALPAYLYFGALGIALMAIDVDTHRLPNGLVLPAYPVLAGLLAVAAIVHSDYESLVRAAIGTAALFGGYFALAFVYPAGMGFGDVKLAGIVGGMLGFLSYQALLVGAFAAFLFGSLVGLGVILSRRGTSKTAVPFGPFMVSGALLAIFAAQPITDLYSRAVLPT